MRNTISIMLAVAMCLLVFKLHSESVTVKNQSLAIADLQRKQSALDKVPDPVSLEMQGKCAKQAAEAFKLDGWSKERFASLESHYNPKFGKCFVRENATMTEGGVPSNTAVILDAFENKTFAQYFWINTQGKKYWEVKPTQCQVTQPSGEEKLCESSDEFNELAKTYME